MMKCTQYYLIIACYGLLSSMIPSGIHGAHKHVHEEPTNIFISTIPKSGTHLVAKLMKLLTQRSIIRVEDPNKIVEGWLPPTPNNEIVRSHLRYNGSVAARFKKENYRCLLMVRDPRDQLISMNFWIVTRPHAHPEEAAQYKADPAYFDKLLLKRIKSIKKYYDAFLPWMDDSRFYTVRFENLVGSEGGGSDKAQQEEIKAIARHINLPVTHSHIQKCAKNLFGGTGTFRKGQIGGWRKHFKEEHKEAFKKVAGQLLIDLGYEKDLNW